MDSDPQRSYRTVMINRIVVDLRQSKCAVGLLTCSEEQTTKWHPQSVTTYVDPTIQVPKEEIDLSFFRKEGDKNWLPIARKIIEELRDKYEVIENLFDEPDEDLKKQFPRHMNQLLKESLNEFSGIPILFLVDLPRAKSLVEDLLGKMRQQGEVKLVTKDPSDLAGFALIDPSQGILPKAGESYLCRVRRGGEKQDILQFTWTGSVFQKDEVSNIEHSDIPSWESIKDLQRAGAALFALIFQERLADVLLDEIGVLHERVGSKQMLFARMQNLVGCFKGSTLPTVSKI